MPYSTPRHRLRIAPMARLFVVTGTYGAGLYVLPSVNSGLRAVLHPRALFHGERASGLRWVRRLPSEGGGFVWHGLVEEVV